MGAVAGRRLASAQMYGAASSRNDGVAAAGRNQRQPAHGGSGMAGGADEPGVLVAGDRKAPDEEFAQVDAMDGSLVFLCVRRPHQKIAGGNARQVRGVGVVIVYMARLV